MNDSNFMKQTAVMAAIAITLVLIGYYKGQGQSVQGLKAGFAMFTGLLPLLLFAFIIAGMVQALLPHDMITRWVGAESGWRGIMVGSAAGALTPAGPFVSFPIAATMMKSGASVGALVAFLAGWSLLSLTRIPLEVGILGWKLTAIRVVCTFFVPPLAGFVAQAVFGRSF